MPTPGSDEFAQLPNTTDIGTLEAAMQANAEASSEFAGGTITLDPGDIITGGGGSATDADGNVWTLEPFTDEFAGTPMSVVAVNGNRLDELGGGGFVVALRIHDGQAVWENGKGFGWFNANDFLGQNDPGAPDPGSSTGGLPDPDGGTPDQPPVTPPDDNVPPPSDDQNATPPDDQTQPPSDDQNTPPVDDETPTPADDQTPTPSDDGSAPPDDGAVVPPQHVHAHHNHMQFVNPSDDNATPPSQSGDTPAEPPPAPVFNVADLVSELVASLHLGAQDDGNGGTLVTFGHCGSVDLANIAFTDVQALFPAS